MNAPTLLGHVGSVAGATISVRQFEGVASGIAIIGGRSYRVGQVGSFVRIPQGYHDLYAIISEVGASATPATLTDALDRGERWMTVQLVGEIVEASFERGISQYPNVNDEVHLVTEEDLAKIYGAEFAGQVVVGRLANAESIPVRLDLDKLVTRHSAVLGSTGSGKSTTVASLLRSISAPGGAGFPSARILLLDIHGEYGRALGDNAEIFRITPGDGEKQLVVPYWALRPTEILNFLCGKMDDRATTAILDKIFAAKSAIALADNLPGVDLNSMTVDSPIPYSLRNLWLEMIDPEVKTWLDQAKTQPAIVLPGDATTLRLPTYQPHTTTNTAPYQNNIGVLGIRKQLDRIHVTHVGCDVQRSIAIFHWRGDTGSEICKETNHIDPVVERGYDQWRNCRRIACAQHTSTLHELLHLCVPQRQGGDTIVGDYSTPTQIDEPQVGKVRESSKEHIGDVAARLHVNVLQRPQPRQASVR